ncbi:hypothetical protein DFP90_102296 [Aestuariispira insulae]|uniref:Uncharacterized protein n=1 Tax=Aestuariispira insulae TaxID=1461337 RepID=A0A3D9HRZ9_9PROT|nr:hypothetical protein DFP90_102296 [Aestuariispira insulae]
MHRPGPRDSQGKDSAEGESKHLSGQVRGTGIYFAIPYRQIPRTIPYGTPCPAAETNRMQHGQKQQTP